MWSRRSENTKERPCCSQSSWGRNIKPQLAASKNTAARPELSGATQCEKTNLREMGGNFSESYHLPARACDWQGKRQHEAQRQTRSIQVARGPRQCALLRTAIQKMMASVPTQLSLAVPPLASLSPSSGIRDQSQGESRCYHC